MSVNQLLRNNPQLGGLSALTPGQVLVIDYEGEKRGNVSVNGYAYPYIDQALRRKTLPYLTYLTLLTHGFTPEGELIGMDDEEAIAIAKEYGVTPLMLISTLTEEGTFSNELADIVLNDPAIQERLINEILANLRTKGYGGLDVDFEYIGAENRDAYTAFIQNITQRLNAEGYPVVVALAPKTSSDQPGQLYEGHDYAALGAAANYVLLMTYEWGYTYGPPMAVAPLNKVREVLDYAVTQIDPEKNLYGDAELRIRLDAALCSGRIPAESLSNVEAVNRAVWQNAAIEFDPTAQAPFYRYYDAQGRQHEVWFEDARSVQAS